MMLSLLFKSFLRIPQTVCQVMGRLKAPHASFLFGTGSRKLLGNGRKSIASRFGSDLQDSQGLCLAKIVFYAFASKLDTEVE